MSLDKKILEEVKRFNLMSDYSPKKTLSENLNEQNKQDNNILQIAGEIMLGAKGLGTNLPEIINAIKKINNVTEFNKVNDVMAKNPSGYKSIIELLQGEIESDNQKELKEIIDSLKTKGVNIEYKTNKNGQLDSKSINITDKPNVTNITPRQQNINNTFCSVNDKGIITTTGKNNNKRWDSYVQVYGIKPEEIEVAKKSCPKNIQKLNWIPEKFPLKYMMQGPNVTKLQQVIDVRNKAGQPNITGKFYNATQFALDKRAKELGLNYNREVGLDQESFNKIVNPTTQNTEVKLDTAATKGTVLPGEETLAPTA